MRHPDDPIYVLSKDDCHTSQSDAAQMRKTPCAPPSPLALALPFCRLDPARLQPKERRESCRSAGRGPTFPFRSHDKTLWLFHLVTVCFYSSSPRDNLLSCRSRLIVLLTMSSLEIVHGAPKTPSVPVNAPMCAIWASLFSPSLWHFLCHLSRPDTSVSPSCRERCDQCHYTSATSREQLTCRVRVSRQGQSG